MILTGENEGDSLIAIDDRVGGDVAEVLGEVVLQAGPTQAHVSLGAVVHLHRVDGPAQVHVVEHVLRWWR